MGINKVILVGNVGNDPESRALPSGTTLCKFRVATTEPRFKDRETGEPHTEWHNIVAWGKLAEICGQYVRRGMQVYIEGRIRTRTYEQDGQKKYFTEINADVVEFLSRRDGPAGGGGGRSTPSSPPDDAGGTFPADNDDVPF
ncbi:MAG: single-stranded DNA-binding protein [Acidobacteria bacterium]|nr:single-stranded DNA-binding protein [Acidobacteriota bacterium]